MARGWPAHRYVVCGLLAGVALPAGSVTVAFGDIWAAGPPAMHLLLAATQVCALWWVDRHPVVGLVVIVAAFLLAQASTRLATTADLAVFVAIVNVGARTRARTALASGAAVTLVLAGFMTVAQAPGHPAAIGQAILPAAIIVAVPLLAGLAYQGLRRPREAAPAHPPPPPAPPSGSTALTARELTILRLIAEGLTNPEIAAKLTIGRETVKTHVGSILVKLGARDRTQAVAMAYRSHILDDR